MAEPVSTGVSGPTLCLLWAGPQVVKYIICVIRIALTMLYFTFYTYITYVFNSALFSHRFYTVRYREKNKDWTFQLCPTTETVIDNLKPNTLYEFGVKDNSDEIWGKSQNHKTNRKWKLLFFKFCLYYV